MQKRLVVGLLVVAVAMCFVFGGCKKKANPEAAKELCTLTGQAAGEMAKSQNPSAPAADVQKLVDEGVKTCQSAYDKLPDEEKNAQYKKAEELLKKCKGKTGKDFGTCVGAM